MVYKVLDYAKKVSTSRQRRSCNRKISVAFLGRNLQKWVPNILSVQNQKHTILFTCRFQNTACRLMKFHRTQSFLVFCCGVKQWGQILVTVRIKMYDQKTMSKFFFHHDFGSYLNFSFRSMRKLCLIQRWKIPSKI